jgi:hypothetical protein
MLRLHEHRLFKLGCYFEEVWYPTELTVNSEHGSVPRGQGAWLPGRRDAGEAVRARVHAGTRC